MKPSEEFLLGIFLFLHKFLRRKSPSFLFSDMPLLRFADSPALRFIFHFGLKSDGGFPKCFLNARLKWKALE